jgi:hypothetical protein
MNTIKIFLTLTIMMLFALSAYSQVSFGADVVSRYVWRGTDFGNSASVQPTLGFSFGNFEIGALGSYALTAGAGTKVYVVDPEGNFNFVNLGVTASKGSLFTSYIMNPEAETNFIVFGYSF